MSIKGRWKTYLHSLIGLSVGLVVIYTTLGFLHTRGPSFIQGPADTVGQAISGKRWNF